MTCNCVASEHECNAFRQTAEDCVDNQSASNQGETDGGRKPSTRALRDNLGSHKLRFATSDIAEYFLGGHHVNLETYESGGNLKTLTGIVKHEAKRVVEENLTLDGPGCDQLSQFAEEAEADLHYETYESSSEFLRALLAIHADFGCVNL